MREKKPKSITRCVWCRPATPLYIRYHDEEWGTPHHDERELFELLVLEGFQAGLSWYCILEKREAFRTAFRGFNPKTVSHFGEKDVERLLQTPGIIRNQAKIRASITNAHAFLSIANEFGSFDRYIWHFTAGKTLVERNRTTSPLSETISADLKRRGMKFVGSTIIYSYLQAIGILDGHDETCALAHPRKRTN